MNLRTDLAVELKDNLGKNIDGAEQITENYNSFTLNKILIKNSDAEKIIDYFIKCA